MNSAELEGIADAAASLKINRYRGRYHKPIALIWAIDRAIRGMPRLATAAVARSSLDPLLEELSGVDSDAAWPWLKLANDLGSAWIVDGADPSADPPATFVAGWSREAYQALAGDPNGARQLIEFVMDTYLGDVTPAVEDALGSYLTYSVDPDTVIVAAKHAYPEYERYSTYICQPERFFRPVDRIGFYRDKQIEALVPRVLGQMDNVMIDLGTADRLHASADTDERRIGELVQRLIDDHSPRAGNMQQIFLLSDPDARETLKLDGPLVHDGNSAWTQSQRYVTSDQLQSSRSTNDL